jgi:hypothetical protein
MDEFYKITFTTQELELLRESVKSRFSQAMQEYEKEKGNETELTHCTELCNLYNKVKDIPF